MKHTAYSVLFAIAVLILTAVSCSSPNGKNASTPQSDNNAVVEQEEETMAKLNILEKDTLWIESDLLDTHFNADFGRKIYKKLLNSSIKPSIRIVKNTHTGQNDKVYTFHFDEAEYAFLVTAGKSNTVFFLHAQSDWDEKKMSKITGIKEVVNSLFNDISHSSNMPEVIVATNLDGGAYLYLTMEDNNIKRFEYINWLD